MSSPFVFILSIVTLLVFSYWEQQTPLYPYAKDRAWFIRLSILGLMGILITSLIGFLLESIHASLALSKALADFFSHHSGWLNGLLAYFVISFFVYWWHRYRHYSNFAWTFFHQIHHSTHRIQALTALYAHPSDYAANILIINVVSYVFLGFNIESAAWATFWVSFFEYWEHTNVKTPHCLGYFLVRPEMHRIHHERDRHSNNYGLPIWDMMFGTYENSSRMVECGFKKEEEEKLAQMLVGKKMQ